MQQGVLMKEIEYFKQMNEFVEFNKINRPEFSNYYSYPCLSDDTIQTGFDTHYIYHIAWAIRKIMINKPKLHIDIASGLHFCTAICSKVPTIFYDYRPAELYMENLTCMSGDLTNEKDWINKKYESLSCMHVVEHIGLGRYGDALDPNGDLKAITNLKNLIERKGKILFVVPVGMPSIFFNAHRVYSASKIHELFAKEFHLNEFYFIPGPVGEEPILNCDFKYTENYTYGCGCYEYTRM